MSNVNETKLALIGAGQIGSRHLQALAKMDRPTVIQLVDPSDESLARAKERFEQVAAPGCQVRLEYYRTINELDRQLDLALITTTAGGRRQLLESLLAHANIKNLILEKVVFQREKDFAEVGQLLASRGIRTWVNCAFRMWPGYQALKRRRFDRLDFHVSGSQWGLACNSVHYLDMFCHLSGASPEFLNTDGLKPGSGPSKRSGFIEVFGTMSASGPQGTVSLTCHESGNAPVSVHISSDTFVCTIREDLSKAWMADAEGGWVPREIEFPVPFQSQLSHLAVSEILDKGTCLLPDFNSSAKVHITVIRSILKHLGRDFKSGEEACPIT